MFFNKELKAIREAKQGLAICADLRRRLVGIEIQGLRSGGCRTMSTLTLGLAVAEQVLGFIREWKRRRA